jgi:Ca2+/Na+ antiporter
LLAIGNVIGSSISNILGAFSLGLIFRQGDGPAQFDRSSRIYSALLLALTTLIMPVSFVTKEKTASVAFGGALIAIFAVYVASVGYAISRGTLSAPEDSDSDSDSDSESDSSSDAGSVREAPRETDALLPQPQATSRRPRRSVAYHVGQLVLGFLAVSLAGFVLSCASINIADATGISDILFGIVVLAIATTLPEKLIAFMSGRRGYVGILTANTAGSNIFLLSLCLGIILVGTPGVSDGDGINLIELAVLWASTVGFTFAVWFGGRFDRWIGNLLLVGYIAFIVAEFTVVH